MDDNEIEEHMNTGPIGFDESCPPDDGWFDFDDSPIYQGLIQFDPRWEEWALYIDIEQWDDEVVPAVHSNFFGVFLSPDDEIHVCGWDTIPEAVTNCELSIAEGYKLEAFYDMIKKRLLDTAVQVTVHIDLESNIDPHSLVDMSDEELVRSGGIKVIGDDHSNDPRFHGWNNDPSVLGEAPEDVKVVSEDDIIIQPPAGPKEDIDVSDADSSAGIIKL